MRLGSYCSGGVLLLLLAGCQTDTNQPEKQPEPEKVVVTHEEAIERFTKFAEGGLQAKGKKTREFFYGCFREGNSADKYERAFRTAKKEVGENTGTGANVTYKWRWTGRQSPNDESMDEYAFLVVVIGGYDNTIQRVYHKYHAFDPSWSD